MARSKGWGDDLWDKDGRRRRTAESTWRNPLTWARTLPKKLGRRPRVFCASLADVFEERPDLEPWRRDLFDLIVATPELDWLLLTKRLEFARDWMRAWYEEPIVDPDPADVLAGGTGYFRHEGDENWHWRDDLLWACLPNVWIGASIENARWTWRANVLREIPAAVRFISAEPLLGSLYDETRKKGTLDLTGIDWMICGGESGGKKARPMHPQWARELRDACAGDQWCDCFIPTLEGAGQHSPGCRVFSRPAFHFKQWGSWEPSSNGHLLVGYGGRTLSDRIAFDAYPDALREPVYLMRYAGPSPKAGGNLLDGQEWLEFPRVREVTRA